MEELRAAIEALRKRLDDNDDILAAYASRIDELEEETWELKERLDEIDEDVIAPSDVADFRKKKSVGFRK